MKLENSKCFPKVFQLATPMKLNELNPITGKLIHVARFETKSHTVIPIMKPISKLIEYNDYRDGN